MKGLYVLGSLFALAACAPQPPPPAAPAPPPVPPMAQVPPPAPPPPAPPPGPMSFEGRYAGSMTSSPAGLSTQNLYRSGCVEERPATMTVRGGYAYIEYADWKRHKLHYRGKVDADGSVKAFHKNSDGSLAILTGQLGNNQFTGDMRRGPCDYAVTLTKQ